MAIRTARAEWTGDFRAGQGVMRPGSGNLEAEYSFGSIYGNGPGTNPIEILGASLAGCFTGGLAAVLERGGYTPNRITTDAEVRLDTAGAGFSIAGIHLHCRADVPGIEVTAFLTCAELMKQKCPVAQVLVGVEITLQADLIRPGCE